MALSRQPNALRSDESPVETKSPEPKLIHPFDSTIPHNADLAMVRLASYLSLIELRPQGTLSLQEVSALFDAHRYHLLAM